MIDMEKADRKIDQKKDFENENENAERQELIKRKKTCS